MSDLLVAADRHIPIPDWMVPAGVRIVRFDPIHGFPKTLPEMDALLIRTVLPVNSTTLPETGQIQFVGTATAGVDHVHAGWLQENGIRFGSSPGCNSRSVAEYVAAALLVWSSDSQEPLQGRSVGIIGAGHAGQATAGILESLGMTPILYDPPREEMGTGFRGATRDEVLRCDILTFHTSYHRDGPHPSHHWMNQEAFRKSNARVVINAARGGVIDEEAMGDSLESGALSSAILDVWEGEPCVSARQVKRARIATPHIAGYSVESKENASRLVIEELCRVFKLFAPVRKEPLTLLRVGFEGSSPLDPPASAREVIRKIHPVLDFDRELRNLVHLTDAERKTGFLNLRAETPLRREFTSIRVPVSWIDRWSWLQILGIEPE